VLSQGDMLLEEHLVGQAPARSPERVTGPERVATLDEVEKEHIARVWALTRGHKGKTCQLLGISRPTLERKLKKYGIYVE
jgi:two-component system response regulator AtoC